MYQRTFYYLKNSFCRSYSSYKSVLKILESGEVGHHISVQGWIKSLRKQKELTFFDINDGSTHKNLQIVLSPNFETKLSVGCSVKTSGTIQLTPKGQTEISANNIILLGECDVTKGYPFLPRKKYAPEYIREYLHFRPQTRKFGSILRLRHAAIVAIHQYLNKNGYINIQTPILTSNDCEGAGEVFKVLPDNSALLKSMAKDNLSSDEAYFDKKTFLTVSGQLHLEAAAHALKKVYCFGPTFRAENSKSRFHLSEFYMLEIEEAFLENLEDLLDIVEQLIINVTKSLLEEHIDDIENCTEKKIDHSWTGKKFIRIPFSEAVDILGNKLNKVISKGSLTKEHELALTEYFGHMPVFVTNWPKAEKPFYMKEIDSNNVAAFDLLTPQIGELVGGSLREDNYEKLKSKIPFNQSHLDWYLDLRKFGNVPTGGFGLGFERYIQFILGIDNIKDSIPFPRWPHNCSL